MALRCFLFSSDEGTSDVIRQVLTGLGVEGESCSQATTAVEKLAQQLFQLVVIDWEQQPEAGVLISAARERKAAERPLILTIVSDDASVQKALQAGANSILRKPLVLTQVTDTLTTARDLLRSRQESASAAAAAAGAAPVQVLPRTEPGPERSLKGPEFSQAAPLAPSGQFETDSEVAHFPDQSVAEETDPLKDLEPVAAAVTEAPSSPAPPPPDERRGLEWYLKARGVARQPGSVLATSQAPPVGEKTELLGYDQAQSASTESAAEQAVSDAGPKDSPAHERKQEAQLFSYISDGSQESAEPSESRSRILKRAIVAALILAACATVAAPQAPWHKRLVGLTAQGQRALHGWLNPQPVTAVTQAPTTHEDFGRAGDEYKLPVAENIPDATTDPSQISVVPVVDPTAKKPTTDPVTEQPTGTTGTPATDSSQTNSVTTPTVQPAQSAPDQTQPAATTTPAAATPPDASAHPDAPAANPAPAVTAPPPSNPAPRRQPTQYTPATTKVPSSLKSQMAAMVPDASGNKPVEAALPSIEPVAVSEPAERGLLTDQPSLAYPAIAAGKQGTVTLEVLIGRDGTVQDAKFLQGSLVFARAAIDNVRQWKFKPYTMNGRPVSVQTNLTLKFSPAQ